LGAPCIIRRLKQSSTSGGCIILCLFSLGTIVISVSVVSVVLGLLLIIIGVPIGWIIWKRHHSYTSGRVALKKVNGDHISNGFVRPDVLVGDSSYTSSNGRHSFIENFPGYLPESRESKEHCIM